MRNLEYICIAASLFGSTLSYAQGGSITHETNGIFCTAEAVLRSNKPIIRSSGAKLFTELSSNHSTILELDGFEVGISNDYSMPTLYINMKKSGHIIARISSREKFGDLQPSLFENQIFDFDYNPAESQSFNGEDNDVFSISLNCRTQYIH